MTIARLTATWTGFSGAPGYTNFYFDVPGVAPGLVVDFFEAIYLHLPGVVTVEVPNSGDLIDEVTGELENTWSATGGASITGGGGNMGAAPAGACISWYTDGIARARRVRGRTFIVPLANGSYENNGSLHGITIPALQGAGDALITASGSNFGIWSRPRLGTGGSFHVATRAAVKDKAAVLRSRRD
jgi:hypothetical protein